MKIDRDMIGTERASVLSSDLAQWVGRPTVVLGGMVMVCRGGRARLNINFSSFDLSRGTIITLLPRDVVELPEPGVDGFGVEMLTFDAALLREACLQMELTVYMQMRDNRCRSDAPTVTALIDTMLTLLRLYNDDLGLGASVEGAAIFDAVVLLQLQAFFLGFHDYVRRVGPLPSSPGSRRQKELFSHFMSLVADHHREYRNVSDYAAMMSITPKYLNNIVQGVTRRTAKTVIDHFVVLQLKAALRGGGSSLKEIAADFCFNDQSFFCRYFKQHTGMTPKAFRLGRDV